MIKIYIKIFIINKYKLLNKYFAFSNYIKFNAANYFKLNEIMILNFQNHFNFKVYLMAIHHLIKA